MRLSMMATVGMVMGIGATAVGCAITPSDSGEESGTTLAAELSCQPAFLALGDSIAFGYDPLVANPTIASNFVGYPDALASITRTTDVNAACPGETSGSFLSATAPDNGCHAWREYYKLPLHTAYAGTQASFAFQYVAQHPETKYVSFNMGANDLFLVSNGCKADPACIQAALPAALAAYGQNVATIFGGLKAAGFTGNVVALKTYATNYADPLGVAAVGAINTVLAQVAGQFGYLVADGYGAFKLLADKKGGDSCAAGLLIKMPDGTCNIHPSKLGREVLAATVGATAVKAALTAY
jgi:hypothetical protein